MGLEQKLLQLDEAIWKEYEKVTHYAEKAVGWDKYDLAKAAYNITLAASGAYTTYVVIRSFKYDQNLFGPVGVGLGATLIAIDLVQRKSVEKIKQYDAQLLKQSSSFVPNYMSNRPIMGLFALGMTIGATVFNPPPQIMNPDERLLMQLGVYALSISILGTTSADYFKSQIPKPPQKSPGKLQKWYRSVRESFGRKVEVGAKYETIEMIENKL